MATRFYTAKGDDGYTGLLGEGRVSATQLRRKNPPRPILAEHEGPHFDHRRGQQ